MQASVQKSSKLTWDVQTHEVTHRIDHEHPPELNVDPEKWHSPKTKVVFQPSIFRGYGSTLPVSYQLDHWIFYNS